MGVYEARGQQSKMMVRVPECTGPMIVTQIHPKTGDLVAEGEPVMSLFSSARLIEVLAPVSGRMIPVVSLGDEVSRDDQLFILNSGAAPAEDIVATHTFAPPPLEDELELGPAFLVATPDLPSIEPLPTVGDFGPSGGMTAAFPAAHPAANPLVPISERYDTDLGPAGPYAFSEDPLDEMRPNWAEWRLQEKVTNFFASLRLVGALAIFAAAAVFVGPLIMEMAIGLDETMRGAMLASLVGFAALIWLSLGFTGSRMASRSVGRASAAWCLLAGVALFGGQNQQALPLVDTDGNVQLSAAVPALFGEDAQVPAFFGQAKHYLAEKVVAAAPESLVTGLDFAPALAEPAPVEIIEKPLIQAMRAGSPGPLADVAFESTGAKVRLQPLAYAPVLVKAQDLQTPRPLIWAAPQVEGTVDLTLIKGNAPLTARRVVGKVEDLAVPATYPVLPPAQEPGWWIGTPRPRPARETSARPVTISPTALAAGGHVRSFSKSEGDLLAGFHDADAGASTAD